MMFLHTLRLAGDLSFYYAFAGFFAASFGGTPMPLVLVWPALCFGLASCFEGSRPLRTTLAALSAAALLFLPTGADKLCYFPAAVYPVLLAYTGDFALSPVRQAERLRWLCRVWPFFAVAMLLWNANAVLSAALPFATAAAVLLVVVLTIFSRKTILATWYLQLETTFLKNFNERVIRSEEAAGRQQRWLDQDLCIISFIAPETAPYLNRRIEDLNWGANYNVYVVKIRHDDKYILLPDGKVSIKAMDKVYVVGQEKALKNFYKLTGLVQNKPIRTLKKFMESDYPKVEHALAVCPIKVRGDESFANKPIKQGHLRQSTKCMILGMQKDGYPIIMPDANMLIAKGDILWIMGSNNHVGALIGEHVE